MPIRRNISGIYFRVKREDGPGYENLCFEDLSEEQQDAMMTNRDNAWLRSLAKVLARKLYELAVECNARVYVHDEEEP